MQFGSEPLFDSVLAPSDLATQVSAAMKNLSSLGIQVDISELAYGWQQVGRSCLRRLLTKKFQTMSEGSLEIMKAIGSMISAHVLPFFDPSASIGK